MSPAVRTLDWQPFASVGEAGVYVARLPSHGETGVHDHIFREIVYVESGTAEHLTAEAPRQLRPGDLIIIRPLVWHAYSRPRNLTIINCLIDQRLMHRLAPLLAGPKALSSCSAVPPAASGARPPWSCTPGPRSAPRWSRGSSRS